MGCKKTLTCEKTTVDKKNETIDNDREGKLFFAYLRRPRNSKDDRTDPKYEEGEFGSTGCHQTNILNGKHIIPGDRLTFLQGGKDKKSSASTVKISYITPPIYEIKSVNGKNVVKWDSNWNNKEERPLKFEYQTNLLEKPDKDKFTKKERKILQIINPNIINANCCSKAQKISSCTRSYCKGRKLASNNAKKLIEFYEKNITTVKSTYGKEIFAEKSSDTYQS